MLPLMQRTIAFLVGAARRVFSSGLIIEARGTRRYIYLIGDYIPSNNGVIELIQ